MSLLVPINFLCTEKYIEVPYQWQPKEQPSWNFSWWKLLTSRILTTSPVDSVEFEELVYLTGSYLVQGKRIGIWIVISQGEQLQPPSCDSARRIMVALCLLRSSVEDSVKFKELSVTTDSYYVCTAKYIKLLLSMTTTRTT